MRNHHPILVVASCVLWLLVSCGDPYSNSSEGSGGSGGLGGNAGATGGSSGNNGTESTRLRPRYLVWEDGAMEFFGWRDTLLDVDCSYAMTVSGLRCLPTARPILPYRFTSSTCAIPVHVETSAVKDRWSEPKYGTYTKDVCGDDVVTELWPLEPFSGTVYAMVGNVCTEAPDPCTLGFFAKCALYKRGDAPVDLESLAFGTIEIDK